MMQKKGQYDKTVFWYFAVFLHISGMENGARVGHRL